MNMKRTADSLAAITRNLSPASCQLAHIPLSLDENLPAPLKKVITFVLLRKQQLDPMTRLDAIFAELMILSYQRPNGYAKRTAEIFEEIDTMEARPVVSEVWVWWSVVQNIVANELRAAPEA